MHPHETVVREFLAALARRDARDLVGHYHPQVLFTDPLFPRLRGEEAADLWRMRLAQWPDLQVAVEAARADGEGGEARWSARYTHPRTGRAIHAAVHSLFAFRDGLIVRHYDRFAFGRWAAQALGPPGRLLGWFAPLKWKVRADEQRALERYRLP